MKCGPEFGPCSQRLIYGEAADVSSPQIMIGGDETYEARCLDCYELKKTKEDKKLFVLSRAKIEHNV